MLKPRWYVNLKMVVDDKALLDLVNNVQRGLSSSNQQFEIISFEIKLEQLEQVAEKQVANIETT